MATWQTITQTGTREWLCWADNITNHEVFAFTLQSAENNIGAYISRVTVFGSNDVYPFQTSYHIRLQAMKIDPVTYELTPVNEGITGNFESDEV
jgi:hypothetical protein